jgi:hypothetical protein
MQNWWVNQNQTYEHEFRGSYLWSPKRNGDSVRARFTNRCGRPGQAI